MAAILWCLSRLRCITRRPEDGLIRVRSLRRFREVRAVAMWLVTRKTVPNQEPTMIFQMPKCSPNPNSQSAWLSKLNQHQVLAQKRAISVIVLSSSQGAIAWQSLINSTIRRASWHSDRNCSQSRRRRRHRHIRIVPRKGLKLGRSQIIIGPRSRKGTGLQVRGKTINPLALPVSAFLLVLTLPRCQYHPLT